MFSSKGSQVSGSVNYIEDVFSTQLYTGAGTSATSNQVIDSDITLASTAAWKTRTILDGTSTYIYKVKKDTAGNYIVLGNSIVSGYYRVLVIKFDSAWNITWEKRISQDSTSQTVSAEALALDASDNIYVALGIEGAAASLVKLNSSGTLQWNRIIEPSSGSARYLNTVLYNTVDGFLYVGGRTSGPGGPGLFAKYNTSGTVQWMKKFKPAGTYYGNQQSGQVKSMAHDSSGNVYFVGLEFDGGWKGIVVKINSSGTVQWNKRVSGTTSGIDSIFIDSSDGIYIGYWDGASFSSSSYAYADVHTTKLNTSGAIVWDRKFVGYPGGPGIASITGDSSGGIYLNLFATIVKHNSSGTFQWSRKAHNNPGTVGFYGVSAIDSTLYATGFTNPSSTGFISELATDGTTTSGTAYHRITGDVLDSAGSQTLSAGNSDFEDHTGPEQAGTATVTTASTAVAVYDQLAVIGSGGLVWTKGRSSGYGHGLFDTVRGADSWLTTSSTAAATSISAVPANPWISSFNIDGFTVGTNGSTNNSGTTYAAWTFRKQPKFFDIVTYTGDGINNRAISHNLGSTPGCIMFKATSATSDWIVYHRSLGQDFAADNIDRLRLNSTAGQSGVNAVVNDVSSTTFTLGNNSASGAPNDSGINYVAYLFAHDAGGFGLTGADNVISCGSVTADGSGGATVNLGYEPQWIMYKMANRVTNWTITDTMRGWVTQTTVNPRVYANATDAESTSNDVGITSTGFQSLNNFGAGDQVIYIAIRKGPMKVPTVGTSVFIPITSSGTTGTALTTTFPVDMQIAGYRTTVDSGNRTIVDRVRGASTTSTSTGQTLLMSSTATETSASVARNWNSTGFEFPSYWSGSSTIFYNFRRAPGFMDIVCYTGAGGSSYVLNHNLAAPAEMIMIKRRNGTGTWTVGTNLQATHILLSLNSTNPEYNPASNIYYFGNGTTTIAPTSTQFTVRTGDINTADDTYVAYLFATLAGVSKVGSYTGTGTTKQIECGFTTGARFVLIKRTDDSGDWYVWDTARGIISGNDPYLVLNTTAVEVTNTDYIDTYSAGFELSSTAPVDINANGGKYIFLAIA